MRISFKRAAAAAFTCAWARAGLLQTSLVVVGVMLGGFAADAQPVKETIQQGINKDRLNQNTVAIVTGAPSGTYLQVAYDMSAVLDKGDELRVLPVIGKGSVQNLRDVLYLKGVDMGIVQTTDLNRIKTEDPGIIKRLVYLTKLYNEELHVLARPEIKSMKDLEGKPVNFSDVGSGTQYVGHELFGKLGINVKQVNLNQADALEKMRTGEVAATIYVAGKPGAAFAKVPRELGFHFLSVEYGPKFEESYYPAMIQAADYPALVPEGTAVETIAIGAILVAFDWPKGSDRQRRLNTFVEAFFEKIEEFHKAPRHPKWQEVNLAAEVPGWRRLDAARMWLEKRQQETPVAAARDPQLRADFERFAKARSASGNDNEKLFEEFLRWREKR
jgi:TRAP transporter TAXI family solute receptor